MLPDEGLFQKGGPIRKQRWVFPQAVPSDGPGSLAVNLPYWIQCRYWRERVRYCCHIHSLGYQYRYCPPPHYPRGHAPINQVSVYTHSLNESLLSVGGTYLEPLNVVSKLNFKKFFTCFTTMFHNGGTQHDNMQAVLHVKHENLLCFQSSLHDRNQSQLRLILIVTKERGKQSYKLFTGSHHAHSNSTCTLTLNLSLLPFTSLSVHIHPYPFSSQPRYSSSISIKTYSIKNSKESKGMFTFTLVPILSS